MRPEMVVEWKNCKGPGCKRQIKHKEFCDPCEKKKIREAREIADWNRAVRADR